MKQLFLIIICAFALVACKPRTSPMRFVTSTVTHGDLRAFVTATGTLSPVVSVDVGCQVSGKVVKLNADFNSPVNQGDLIAEIDTALYAAKVKAALGELVSANASVQLSQKNLERKKTLLPSRAVSELEIEQAVSELAQAEASVIIKDAALDQARVDMSYCSITAPVDGIVISRKVDPGQTVTAAMTTPVLFTIAQDITQMHITASVSEADIGRVSIGDRVDFTVDAFPDETFNGSVTQVRMSPTTKENVVTYETIIAVDNPEKKLFPGMNADVAILVAQRANVLKLPNAALRFTPPDNAMVSSAAGTKLERRQHLVYVLEAPGTTVRAVAVSVGITDNTETEITDGLEPGAAVVTAVTGLIEPSFF